MALTEGNRLNDVLFWEIADVLYSREKITLLSGQNLKVGAVLGKNLISPTAAGSAGTNVGNGTIGTVTAGTAAQRGKYRAVCVEPAANAGTFAVYDPKGVFIGVAVVAVAFAGEVGFTIADGSTDFSVGDSFIVEVTAGSYKHKEYDPAASDGAKRVAGFLGADTNATAADLATMGVLRGPAIVKNSGLVWKSGLTADQKTAGKDELAALGIITRDDA